MKQKTESTSAKNNYASFAKAASMGMHFISGMLVGGSIGYGLDVWLKTAPFFCVSFLFFGILAGFWNIYLDTKLLLRQMKQLDAKNND